MAHKGKFAGLFNTLDVIQNIDWSYFCIDGLANNEKDSFEEIKIYLVKNLNRAIRNKRKLNYITEADRKLLLEVKKEGFTMEVFKKKWAEFREKQNIK